jgi:divalent metal cation (Fe/Co/Zn/Cd) transporter
MNAQIINQNIFHSENVKRGQRLEYLTIGWNSLEALIAVGAGLMAGSIALVGFGFDSIIEVSSGAIGGWWWADPVAGLIMIPIIAKEGIEALRGETCGCNSQCS